MGLDPGARGDLGEPTNLRQAVEVAATRADQIDRVRVPEPDELVQVLAVDAFAVAGDQLGDLVPALQSVQSFAVGQAAHARAMRSRSG